MSVIIATAIAIGFFIGNKLHFHDPLEKLFATNPKKDKLNRLIDYIDYEYVDEINTDSVVDATINNILSNLDPHSIYIPKENTEVVSENMERDFIGIGVQFYMDSDMDTIAVIRVVENGPSFKKGIQVGDRILMANNDTLFGGNISKNEIVEKLKGKKGTKIKLKIYRKKENKTFTATINRELIPIKSVVAYYMLMPDMGYIKVNRFAESTYKEFKVALSKLQKQGAKKLVLDLRDNPGGYLRIAKKIADGFLEDGKLILFTKDKNGKIDKTYATNKGVFEDKPVYVLINGRSASASEIVAGALQDNDIGTIVGRRSFGKGLVQREMAMGDGSAIRLTTSRYYTPTGRSIQRSYKSGNKDYYQEFATRYHRGELISVDSITVIDSLKFTTPKGKVVYGGGGIIPDVFVPIGSNQVEAVEWLESINFLSPFIFKHLEEDRTRYDSYKRKDFVDNFKVDDILFEKFIDYAEASRTAKNLNLKYYSLEEQIKLYIKASLAEQLYNSNTYAKIKSSGDAMLKKVIMLDSSIVLQKETVN